MAAKPTEMVRAALEKRRKRELDTPPWLPVLLPAGIALVAVYIAYGIATAPEDTPPPPSATEEQQGPQVSVTGVPAAPGPLADSIQPMSYYIALTAAVNYLTQGDPGLPTTSGLMLPDVPEWEPGTFSYESSDSSEDEEGVHWFTVRQNDGQTLRVKMDVYYDGRRWTIRD